jgi:hypothetical protein
MGSVSTAVRKLVPHKHEVVAREFPSELSFRNSLQEQAILFARRRMLDWKMQSTRLAVVLGGSALVFVAWRGLVNWLG